MHQAKSDLEEYTELLRILPRDLTPSELSMLKTSERPDIATQTIAKTAAVLRDGKWQGVLVIIHRRGVVGHIVSPEKRDSKADARDDAQAIIERIMDYHEKMTGVRNRGLLPDDDED